MIVIPVQQASTFFRKSVGLIGAKKPYPLFFVTRWGIHTFGMHFPIMVIILDNSYTIVRMKKITPNRIFFWPPTWQFVLELPCELVKQKNLHLGDILTLDIIN